MNKRIIIQACFLSVVTLLFSLNTFSQTKLNIDISNLRSPDIKCYIMVYLEQKDARFPNYQYLIENDTINDIVYPNGAEMKIKLPFDGEITSDNLKIEYTLKIKNTVHKGILNDKLVMDKENYFKFLIKNKKPILSKSN